MKLLANFEYFEERVDTSAVLRNLPFNHYQFNVGVICIIMRMRLAYLGYETN